MITSITMQSRWNKSYLSVKNNAIHGERDIDDLHSELQNEIERMQVLEKLVKSLNADLSRKIIAAQIISATGVEPIVTIKTKKKRTYYIGGLTIHEDDNVKPVEPARSLQDMIVDLWHISKTALAGGEFVPTRYDRMNYIKKTLLEKYPERCPKSPKQLWLDIEEFTSPVLKY